MGEEIRKQNTFSRTLANDGKAGAFYTDTAQCALIGKLLQFEDEDEKLRVLEPSIGDGSAVKAVLDSMGAASKAEIYGVELRNEAAIETRRSVKACLNADFLYGVRISHDAFPFCFSNPPYGTDYNTGERYEKLFAEKTAEYLAAGGVYVLVVPDYVLREDKKTVNVLLRNFKMEAVYRFQAPVYHQFKQSVYVGRKKEKLGCDEEERNEYYAAVENMQELPNNFTGRKTVVSAQAKELSSFTTKVFDAEAAKEYVAGSPLPLEKLGKNLFQALYHGNEIPQPVIPLSNDMHYLLAISGAGQGIAGSEESDDIHLQRGTVKRATSQTVEVEEKGGNTRSIIKEREYSVISLVIIEADGTITRFDESGQKGE